MSGTPVRAVLLDALGTLVELRDPAPRLRAALLADAGIDVELAAAERAFAAEIAYYMVNQMRGGDRAGLDALRDDCAEVMRAALVEAAPHAASADHAAIRRAMLAALEFDPYPDVAPALAALRRRGLALVVVSNWDCSLPDWLDRAGIAPLIDGAVSSAAVGAAKPAAAVFEAGLRLAGCAAAEALFVGDSVDNDVLGARAAGLRGVLVQRHGDPPAGVEAVDSLERVADLL
ncbi:MAG: HAD-IA family hydrolase [Solirubrobacterales bacterium]|nr:HAD-IA family hydrolase [Solirubrobacterales bacterium]